MFLYSQPNSQTFEITQVRGKPHLYLTYCKTCSIIYGKCFIFIVDESNARAVEGNLSDLDM